jgi:hypothetical protein
MTSPQRKILMTNASTASPIAFSRPQAMGVKDPFGRRARPAAKQRRPIFACTKLKPDPRRARRGNSTSALPPRIVELRGNRANRLIGWPCFIALSRDCRHDAPRGDLGVDLTAMIAGIRAAVETLPAGA